MPALMIEKAAEFISTNPKEGDQTEGGAAFLLPRMSSLFTSEEKPNHPFAQFPPPFSFSSYISKNNSL